ncbi:MAG TPA: polyphenol oxidase family protein [Desulfobacterales bacterium]|nr:polyphenol oxidase family protein [Desulfobacterales bacterium]
MLFRTREGLGFFQFGHFAQRPEIRHAVFTRLGGCSRDPFRGLNVSFDCGDERAAVAANRRLLVGAVGGGELVGLRQTHGTDLWSLSREDLEDRPPRGPAPSADGAVTDVAGRLLLIQVADCQSVMLYDPRRRVVANVHCGWRGSIANILGGAVALMQRRFGCQPETIMAGIGPSLGPCCAEFVNYRREIPEKFWGYRIGGDHFDFWALSRDQLRTAGLPESQIACGQICSRCNPHLFFSYRRARETGRFAAVIGLAEP